MVIIREDLQKKQEEEDRKKMEEELKRLELEQTQARSRREERGGAQSLGPSRSAWLEKAEQFQAHIEEAHGNGPQPDRGVRRSIDLKNAASAHESSLSETPVSGFLGPKDMQNPQGESMGDAEEDN